MPLLQALSQTQCEQPAVGSNVYDRSAENACEDPTENRVFENSSTLIAYVAANIIATIRKIVTISVNRYGRIIDRERAKCSEYKCQNCRGTSSPFFSADPVKCDQRSYNGRDEMQNALNCSHGSVIFGAGDA